MQETTNHQHKHVPRILVNGVRPSTLNLTSSTPWVEYCAGCSTCDTPVSVCASSSQPSFLLFLHFSNPLILFFRKSHPARDPLPPRSFPPLGIPPSFGANGRCDLRRPLLWKQHWKVQIWEMKRGMVVGWRRGVHAWGSWLTQMSIWVVTWKSWWLIVLVITERADRFLPRTWLVLSWQSWDPPETQPDRFETWRSSASWIFMGQSVTPRPWACSHHDDFSLRPRLRLIGFPISIICCALVIKMSHTGKKQERSGENDQNTESQGNSESKVIGELFVAKKDVRNRERPSNQESSEEKQWDDTFQTDRKNPIDGGCMDSGQVEVLRSIGISSHPSIVRGVSGSRFVGYGCHISMNFGLIWKPWMFVM